MFPNFSLENRQVLQQIRNASITASLYYRKLFYYAAGLAIALVKALVGNEKRKLDVFSCASTGGGGMEPSDPAPNFGAD